MADADEITDQPPEEDPSHIKNLRKKAERTDAAEAANTKLARELAFTKAGFDTDHPLVSALMGTYDGDLSKEAVTAHMDSLQVTSLFKTTDEAPPPETIQPPTDTGVQTRDRLGAIDTGMPASQVPTDDPRFSGLSKAFDALEQGVSREDAASLFFADMFTAAVKGDPRVLTVNQSEVAPEPEHVKPLAQREAQRA